jgi:hypothetical protein
MSIVSVRAALETRLSTIAPPIATVKENESYTPSMGTPFQKVYLLPASPENPVFGPKFYREQGLLQVTLCYPLQEGPGAAAARGELIRAAFVRGLSLVSGGVTVTITSTPEIGASQTDGGWYALPVKIRWHSNILT